MEAEIGFVDMEEVENRRMGRFETDSVARSEKAAVRFGTVEDRFGKEGDHSEKVVVHFGTVGVHFGMERGHFEIEEAVHSEIEVESRAHLVEGTAEAAQTLDLEVDQNPAVEEEMETVVADRAVAVERKVEERQNKTSFGVCLQTTFVAAVAEVDSLASQPSRDFLVHMK